MAGVRIQHPTERNCTYVLVDQSRRYLEPLVCPLCATTHLFKTYHFTLDETGSCIVSVEIAERLKRVHGHGFEQANEVKAPPAQRIVPGVIIDRRPLVHPQLKEST